MYPSRRNRLQYLQFDGDGAPEAILARCHPQIGRISHWANRRRQAQSRCSTLPETGNRNQTENETKSERRNESDHVVIITASRNSENWMASIQPDAESA